MASGISRRDFLRHASTGAAVAATAALGTHCAGPRIPLVDESKDRLPLGVIREKPRTIPVVGEYDLCVVGGGCTGVCAAVAAARLGAKVAIVESNGFFGGVATASFVNIWHSIYDTTHERQIIAGLTQEVIERLKRRDAVVVAETATRGYVLNTEELKIELDELVTQAGVRPFLHALFVAPILSDDRLVAIAIEDKSGRRAIKASYFIDASGDADLIARMGLSFYKHDNIQPPTMCAVLRGLKATATRHAGFNIHQVVFDPRYANALPLGFSWGADVPGSRDDFLLAATRVFGADCSDADQLTLAELDGRRQVRAICNLLRENFPIDEKVPLVALPARIGIRDSRHAQCRHQLTEQEVLSGRRFPDAIANGSYRVDIHLSDRGGIIFRYLDGKESVVKPDGSRSEGRWRPETPINPTFYQIPYAALVPNGVANVLIAGRCIDADPGAFGAVRVMVNCNQMGQAAGTAAYLALRSNRSVGEIDTRELRSTLSGQGALII